MELKWDDATVVDRVPFSKDVFDKFSLAPSMKELWAISQSSNVKGKEKEKSKRRAAGSLSEPKPTKSNQSRSQTSSRTSQTSAGPTEDCSQTPTDCRNNLSESKALEGFPEPDVPYPCYSALNIKERRAYLHLLRSRNYHTAPQALMEKVNMEVAEFMNYLQDVSKVCGDVYKCLPPGAARYSEEYFKACLDHMKSYPQVYTIQEITSLTGGKFVSDISLNFEKQLLAMGNVEMLAKRMVAENTQLIVDYDSLSAVISPCQKAKRLHTPISSDTNAEKLSATYEPHVCLTKEAFLQIINNSAGCTEAWELPVWVKGHPGKGKSQSKTVYIDPPLLKMEMSWRERNHLLHEESVKLAYKKTGSKPMFFLTSEDYSNKMDFAQNEASSRAMVSFDNSSIDFAADVTDVESFGESCQPSKRIKDQNEPKALSTNGKLGLSPPKADVDDQNEPKALSTNEKLGSSPPIAVEVEEQPSPQPLTAGACALPSAASTPVEEEVPAETAKTAEEDGLTEGSTEAELEVLSSSGVDEDSVLDCPPAKRKRHCSAATSFRSADSDEEHLVIDYPESLLDCTEKTNQAKPPAPESPADSMAPSLSQKNSESTVPTSPTSPTSPASPARGTRKRTKRARVQGHCDQLGQILRMQNAMLKATPSKAPEPPKAQPPAECRAPAGRGSGHPPSLVKTCVSSYLESKEGQHEEGSAPAPPRPIPQRTRLLRDELLVSGEDESDYELPCDDNLLYKLYSLQDVLLMVRSSVPMAHPRHDLHVSRAVPVHVLPKLEYQLCYGGEILTHGEACRLWAEQLLHSSTVSFIGRINARTSKVAQLHHLPADWIQNTCCDFKPARSLNTLYHILKKVMGLQEGRYLLSHKPGEAFVTIYKATDGTKASRSTYDLQAVHCGLPAEARAPWVPLDPFHVMPFHMRHKRPPCTFPPCPPKTSADKGAKKGKTATGPKPGTQSSKGKGKRRRKRKMEKQKQWKPSTQKGPWTESVRSTLKKDLPTNQTSKEN